MKKKILLLLSMFFILTGCKNNFSLDVDKTILDTFDSSNFLDDKLVNNFDSINEFSPYREENFKALKEEYDYDAVKRFTLIYKNEEHENLSPNFAIFDRSDKDNPYYYANLYFVGVEEYKVRNGDIYLYKLGKTEINSSIEEGISDVNKSFNSELSNESFSINSYFPESITYNYFVYENLYFKEVIKNSSSISEYFYDKYSNLLACYTYSTQNGDYNLANTYKLNRIL